MRSAFDSSADKISSDRPRPHQDDGRHGRGAPSPSKTCRRPLKHRELPIRAERSLTSMSPATASGPLSRIDLLKALFATTTKTTSASSSTFSLAARSVTIAASSTRALRRLTKKISLLSSLDGRLLRHRSGD